MEQLPVLSVRVSECANVAQLAGELTSSPSQRRLKLQRTSDGQQLL